MAFEVLMNGVGNAFSRVHWGTHFLLRRGDYVLAVDCPDSYRRALKENGFEGADGTALDVDALDAMIITHLHGDHVNGLEMGLAYRYHILGEPMELYTSPEAAEPLWDRRLEVALGQIWDGESYQSVDEREYYSLTELPWREEVEIGPFTVETCQTVHHLPTMALRITDGDTSLGYSCDTAFDPDLVDWLSDCDLILHETSYGPGHTRLANLLELPDSVRDKMVVVHLPDNLLEIADQVDIEFGREGEIYSVGDQST